jgi:hypothetical protein
VLVEGQLVSEHEVYVVEEEANPGKILALGALTFLDNFATATRCAFRTRKVCPTVFISGDPSVAHHSPRTGLPEDLARWSFSTATHASPQLNRSSANVP